MYERDNRQDQIQKWIEECFGKRAMALEERAARFFEEACELAQSLGLTENELYKIVEVVHSRPAGRPYQELGGCSTTLLACAQALGFSLEKAEKGELKRILETSKDHFRKRQNEKADLGISMRTQHGG